MKIELKTKRLELVPLEMKYLESTHSYAGSYENAKFMMFLPNDTIEDTRNFILRCEEQWRMEKPIDYEFAVLFEGKHVGGINLELYQDSDTAEVGWIVHKDYWRKGITTEAAERIFQFAKEELKLNRIFAHCDAENVASYRTMEKLGMQRVSESGGRKNKYADQLSREYLYEFNLK